MKSLSIVLVAVFAIVVTAFVFFITIEELEAPIIDDADISDDSTDTNEPEEVKDGYLIFENEELGIRFEYPEEWGELQVTFNNTTPSSEIDNSDADWRTETIIIIPGVGSILSSYTGGEIMGRGGYWADYVTRTQTADQVNTLCNSLESPEFFAQPSESCSNFTNLSGVEFVELSGSTDWYGDITNNVDLYLAHHPVCDYYGLAISTQELAQDGTVTQETADQIYRIVMSLEYID